MKIPSTIRFLIQRFEINNNDNPEYYIVAFNIICDLNSREQYIETTIPIGEVIEKSDNEICELAFNKLKSKIKKIINELENKKFIVGSEFIPPVDELEI